MLAGGRHPTASRTHSYSCDLAASTVARRERLVGAAPVPEGCQSSGDPPHGIPLLLQPVLQGLATPEALHLTHTSVGHPVSHSQRLRWSNHRPTGVAMAPSMGSPWASAQSTGSRRAGRASLWRAAPPSMPCSGAGHPERCPATVMSVLRGPAWFGCRARGSDSPLHAAHIPRAAMGQIGSK